MHKPFTRSHQLHEHEHWDTRRQAAGHVTVPTLYSPLGPVLIHSPIIPHKQCWLCVSLICTIIDQGVVLLKENGQLLKN